MAFYKLTIRKQFVLDPVGTHVWSNVYTVQASDEEGALDVGAGIVSIEQDCHFDTVYFLDYSARQNSELAGSGRKRTLGVVGDRASTGLQFLANFNTFRVILTDGINRPDQKYLRLPMLEDDQSGGVIENGALDFVVDNYITPLLALGGVVSSDEVPYTSGSVWPYVQMRQLRWKRRARPGFHRDYVPD